MSACRRILIAALLGTALSAALAAPATAGTRVTVDDNRDWSVAVDSNRDW